MGFVSCWNVCFDGESGDDDSTTTSTMVNFRKGSRAPGTLLALLLMMMVAMTVPTLFSDCAFLDYGGVC